MTIRPIKGENPRQMPVCWTTVWLLDSKLYLGPP